MPTKKKAKAKKSDTKKVIDLLGELDVVFIIDSTGSMGPYITEAKNRCVSILKDLQEKADLNIRAALVAYRDHPPQDATFVTKVYDFDVVDNFQTSLNELASAGGGDHPEAVWPAVKELSSLAWRKNSDRMAYLIGDAPPHGHAGGYGDHWPQGDPSGITVENLIDLLTEFKIQLNAHSIANESTTTKAFTLLTEASNGQISTGDRPQDGTSLYTDTLTMRGSGISDSRALYANASSAGTGYATAADSLGWSEQRKADAIEYLSKKRN